MDRRKELRGFLRSRRARLRPEDVGLPLFDERRRVPGLRREELAQLAGVSISHYTRLEQGQYTNVSAEVLDAIASALRLRADEHEYLHNLVQLPRTTPGGHPGRTLENLQYLVDSITGVPAYITGRYGDALAWNRLTALTLFDFDTVPPDRRTWTHAIFLDTVLRTRLTDAGQWERAARFQIGYLRLCWSRFPDDPVISAAIAELLRISDDFRRLWGEHLIHNWPQKRVRIRHERVGALELELEVMRPDGAPELAFASYAASPGSPTEAALGELAAGQRATVRS
ncbi:XRE family transcriptional regulator [Streptomyces triticagri]|uniref:XRE family transcriptional regulator n=1 Tax=Streptomyces triticagri TaxID=2293568 RepID=A0A372LW82_9ACTN|nr:helix-turn-helix transcriptional regulator [Streptomyces triticagri]RFU82932.1 XRE family transcriptional regulator [Streptomyces triticagri]